MIPSACKSANNLEGLWPQDVCPTRMLCIPKELGTKGQLHDFCSCEFGRVMLWDGENGCLLSPSSYIILGVSIILIVMSVSRGLWLIRLLILAYQHNVIRFNSHFLAMFCTVGVAVSSTITGICRCVLLMTADQHTYDQFFSLQLFARITIAPFSFVVLIALGNSIYAQTIQALQVPVDVKLDRRRKFVLLSVFILFCGVVVPLSAIRSYAISAVSNAILSIICWWPFKRLGRRLLRVFPVINLPPGYRERSFAICEKLRIATGFILFTLYFRLIGTIILVICAFAQRRSHEAIFHTHLDAISENISIVAFVLLIWITTSVLADITWIRLETAIHLQAISMLVTSQTCHSNSITISIIPNSVAPTQ
jgi:hypothetical protein